jgi:hypothetical protein
MHIYQSLRSKVNVTIRGQIKTLVWNKTSTWIGGFKYNSCTNVHFVTEHYMYDQGHKRWWNVEFLLKNIHSKRIKGYYVASPGVWVKGQSYLEVRENTCPQQNFLHWGILILLYCSPLWGGVLDSITFSQGEGHYRGQKVRWQYENVWANYLVIMDWWVLHHHKTECCSIFQVHMCKTKVAWDAMSIFYPEHISYIYEGISVLQMFTMFTECGALEIGLRMA